MRNLHRGYQKKCREIQFSCHAMRSKVGDKTLRIFFPHSCHHVETNSLPHGQQQRWLSYPLTAIHSQARALLSAGWASFCNFLSFMYHFSHLPTLTITLRDVHDLTGINLCKIHTEYHHTMNPAPLFITTPGHSVRTASFWQALGLCQYHQPLFLCEL